MRPSAARLLAAMIVAVSSLARAGHAETKHVLLVAEAPTPFSARLGAEIETMGFEVARGPTFDESGAGDAVAAVRVFEAPPRRVELWITDGGSGRFSLVTVVRPSPADDDASQAVRASEQLRAFLQPLRESEPAPLLPEQVLPPPPVQSPPPPPPAPPESIPAPAERRSFVAELSIATPFEPGGPGVDVLVEGRWALTSRVGAGALLGIPLSGSTVRSGGNSATVSASILGPEVSFGVVDSPPLRVTTTAAIALAWIRTQGTATPPYTSHGDGALAALPLVGAEISPALTPRVRLALGARVGLALPRADVDFAHQRVATWGRPLGLLSAGVAAEF